MSDGLSMAQFSSGLIVFLYTPASPLIWTEIFYTLASSLILTVTLIGVFYTLASPLIFDRDPEEKHAMITRSVAKDTYLLKDGDIDIREPPLKYLLKKNPRNDHWGDMKLYLECQVCLRD